VNYVYYLDESGNTGDLVRMGDRLDFGGQPIFALVCIGLQDEADLEREVQRLRTVHNIQGAEVKSTNLRNKPGFVSDLATYLRQNQIPLFIEVVEKRYFVCIHLVQSLILPPVGSVDFDAEAIWLKNAFAEHLRITIPDGVLKDFADACDNPSLTSVRTAFDSLAAFLRQRPSGDQAAWAMLRSVEQERSDLEERALTDEQPWKPILPSPDSGKKGKQFWMLPNLSSFTNIYARINHFSAQQVDGITIVHDEQLQFDEIIEFNKKTMERIFHDKPLPLISANYSLKQSASLVFRSSHSSIGIQVADVLAGFVMCYVQEALSKNGEPTAPQQHAFSNLGSLTNEELGLGINFALSYRELERLRIGATSNVQMDFIPPGIPGFPTKDES